MPTYEYKCSKCKKKFDISQPITAGALKKCPKCGGKIERQIGGGGGLIFKGSGFYATDYKRKIVQSESTKPSATPDKPKS